MVALAGIVAIVVGYFGPVSAQAGGHSGSGSGDKPWICHPVEGYGETGYGWNLIDPARASRHIDEATGQGFHTRKDESTDAYAVSAHGVWVCPGGPTTSSTTTQPTETTSTTTDEPTTETSTTSSTTTPEVPAYTEPTTPEEAPATGATTPAEPAETGAATEGPAQQTPQAEVPELGAYQENIVPRAATDGADLAASGWTPLRYLLSATGLVLVATSGLLSLRRTVKG